MNSPNRKSVKTTSAPGKRHFESTKPFREPRMVEMTVAGMTSLNVFVKFGDSLSHASRQPSSVHVLGSDQAWAGSVSVASLKLVTMATYSGVRTRTAKKMIAPNFSARAVVRLTRRRPRRIGAGIGGAGVVAVLMLAPPSEWCRRGRE